MTLTESEDKYNQKISAEDKYNFNLKRVEKNIWCALFDKLLENFSLLILF